MAFSLKHCVLLLVVAVAICMQLHNAQFVPRTRCICHTTVMYTRKNITDFQVFESGPSCPDTVVIVTTENPDNTREDLCLNPQGKLSKAFIICWKNINRNATMKVTCLNKRKKQVKVTE